MVAPGSALCILVVEDDPGVRDVIQLALEAEGWQTAGVGDGAEAIAWATEQPPALVVLDQMLPGQSGLTVGTWLRARYGPQLPIVVLSAVRDFARAGAEHVDAFAFLAKPFDLAELVALVRQGLARTAP